MEVLKETPVLEFNPTTLEEVREELNLTHDGIIQMLDNFEEWILKQQHFTKKDFSRTYLELCLIHAKGSTERAKKNMDKLCTLKTLLPSFFEKHDVKKEFIDISSVMLHGTMPKLSKNNYRIYLVKLVSSDINASYLLDYNRFIILMSEYVKIHDYSLGFICVVDCRDVNILSFASKINIIDLRNSMTVLMEGYGVRINAVYVISESKTIDVFVTLLKQVLSNKLGGRIHVVKTVEELHERVPKELLPKDYGGENKTIKEINENWASVLSQPKNVEYFKEMSQAKTNEKNRHTDRYNEQMSEYVKIHDYSLGFICVVDCRDVNILSFASKINIIDLRNSMTVLMEGYGVRINAVYVISESKTIDVFVTLLKQVLSNKLGGRIHVVKTVEELHERVPKELLPKDYGGENKTIKEINENWASVLSQPKNVEYFKEMSQAKTNEKNRHTDRYNEQVLGMPGSFRTLTVD